MEGSVELNDGREGDRRDGVAMAAAAAATLTGGIGEFLNDMWNRSRILSVLQQWCLMCHSSTRLDSKLNWKREQRTPDSRSTKGRRYWKGSTDTLVPSRFSCTRSYGRTRRSTRPGRSHRQAINNTMIHATPGFRLSLQSGRAGSRRAERAERAIDAMWRVGRGASTLAGCPGHGADDRCGHAEMDYIPGCDGPVDHPRVDALVRC